jgi:mRNA-degrading endonuclease RelE of RelBE toxin-antitoxin system
MYSFVFAESATQALKTLKHSPSHAKQFKAVQEALKFLQHNPRHPGLETHKFLGLKGPQGQDVFEAYAQQQTPRAYRIFFCYGKTRHVIEVLAVVPHPD